MRKRRAARPDQSAPPELPWERVDQEYVLEGPRGRETLSRRIDGRPQLVVPPRRIGARRGGRTTTIAELPGVSVFQKDDDGQIFHTYSCYVAAYHWLDLLPKGRGETALHDEYER